jgi:hypothetical protein
MVNVLRGKKPVFQPGFVLFWIVEGGDVVSPPEKKKK